MLDDTLKAAQVAFYITASVVALLTYLKAKKTLLSSVNTEYQKRVIQRLGEVSDLLLQEFDVDSPRYWARTEPAAQIVSSINDDFSKGRAEILKDGEFEPGIPWTDDQRYLERLVETLKSDPFLPKKIRDIVGDLLENRVATIHEIYITEARAYARALAKGKHLDTLDTNRHWVHNRINDALYERGCGVSQIQGEVHEIRLAIQRYLESFDPRQ
jgi:hypothetical protein